MLRKKNKIVSILLILLFLLPLFFIAYILVNKVYLQPKNEKNSFYKAEKSITALFEKNDYSAPSIIKSCQKPSTKFDNAKPICSIEYTYTYVSSVYPAAKINTSELIKRMDTESEKQEVTSTANIRFRSNGTDCAAIFDDNNHTIKVLCSRETSKEIF